MELAFGDVRELATVQDAMRGCSHVVHLAAAKTIHNVSRAEYHAVNVRGTRNLTDAARTEGVTRFVYGSAIGVHGFVAGQSLNESSPARPNTRYRLSKWMGENVVQDAHRREGLPSVVARISTAVGRDAKGWLPFARAIQEDRLRLIGDGTNQIDLVAVADLVDGLWQCATVPGVEGRVYMLGSSQPQTVGTFAAEIARRLGSRAPRRGLPQDRTVFSYTRHPWSFGPLGITFPLLMVARCSSPTGTCPSHALAPISDTSLDDRSTRRSTR